MTDTADRPRTSRERTDLVADLAKHRGLLRRTVEGITEEQARRRTTVSELTLGGLVKHVAEMERRWMRFAVGGAEAMDSEPVDWATQFELSADETLAGMLDAYAAAAARTDELVATLDLDEVKDLPVRPWFRPGAQWSVRTVILHLIGETSQHSGHADIIREALDGAKTMG